MVVEALIRVFGSRTDRIGGTVEVEFQNLVNRRGERAGNYSALPGWMGGHGLMRRMRAIPSCRISGSER